MKAALMKPAGEGFEECSSYQEHVSQIYIGSNRLHSVSSVSWVRMKHVDDSQAGYDRDICKGTT